MSEGHTTSESPVGSEPRLPGDWTLQAACRGKPPHWWFPDAGMSNTPDALRAKQICGSCPVQTDCLDWAITVREPSGIWGGLGIKGRRRHAKGAPVRNGRAGRPRADRDINMLLQSVNRGGPNE